MSTEINSTDFSQVIAQPKSILGGQDVQTPTEAPAEGSDVDFLQGTIAADPESFNVCISCD